MYLLWRRDTTTRGNKKITLPQIICLQLSALHQKNVHKNYKKNILIWDENGGCVKLVLLFMLGNLVKIGKTISWTTNHAQHEIWTQGTNIYLCIKAPVLYNIQISVYNQNPWRSYNYKSWWHFPNAKCYTRTP